MTMIDWQLVGFSKETGVFLYPLAQQMDRACSAKESGQGPAEAKQRSASKASDGSRKVKCSLTIPGALGAETRVDGEAFLI